MKGKILLILLTIPFLALIITLIIFSLKNNKEEEKEAPSYIIQRVEMKVNDYTLYILLEGNEASSDLVKKINEEESITIEFSDYGGFEKVGNLGFDLKTNDTKITTEENDVMLYQGNKMVIFYGKNTYSYTRLGKIINETGVDLKTILQGNKVTITLKMEPIKNILYS